ncbi:hypothetical protein [Streptomyces bohaiensis]|uniref:hypothetical protein n=1 Tax=Streptomyces bohaiensis TaxID=1431344 RepID=UPI003B795E23
MGFIKKAAGLVTQTGGHVGDAAYGEAPGSTEGTTCPDCGRWYRLAAGHDCPKSKQRNKRRQR